MAEENQGTIQIEASPDVRAGVHSDIVMAFSKEGITRLDFILTDAPGQGSGDQLAVLSSRVFMSNESLVRLRDMLIRHTSSWEVTEVPSDAE